MPKLDEYTRAMLFNAGRACLKHGLNRSEATIAFMEQYDIAKQVPETKRPAPVLLPAIGELKPNRKLEDAEIVAAGLRKCGKKEEQGNEG